MRSASLDSLPPKVRFGLAKLGRDIASARRKRRLTSEMMAERIGVARGTYGKLEKGDPSVSIGAYGMALFVLGRPDGLGNLIDPGLDDTGLLLEAERLPKRVRPKKAAVSL
jgi:transcriptional regulator with XRE-family HTH domain